MSNAKHTPELLRSGFDIDAVRVEFLFDQKYRRYTVATRWVNLAHFDIGLSEISKRVAHEKASAAFEFVCLEGAAKENAVLAKRAAANLTPSMCVSGNGFEREIIRRASIAKARGE